MFKKWVVPVFAVAMLTVACDQPPPQPAASSATATSTATVATVTASAKASATATAMASSTASALALASAEPPAPPVPEPVTPIRVQDPQGVEFIYQSKWSETKLNYNMLNGMEHAENRPIMDLVIMHTAVLTTKDSELEILRRIQLDHINGRGWGDISAHYLIGPSGKVYQGRKIWYRYPGKAVGGSVGAGMGRFDYSWSKCSIMMLGNFNDPSQEFTEDAKQALLALIDDRRTKFGRMYRKALDAREAETAVLLGSGHQKGQNHGLDVIRTRIHPSLPHVVREFLLNPDGEEEPEQKKPQLKLRKVPKAEEGRAKSP